MLALACASLPFATLTVLFFLFIFSIHSVAKKLGRKFVGVEVDEYYCNMAQKRLKLAEKSKMIQGYEDGVFWERNTLRDRVKIKQSAAKSESHQALKVKRK